jgi:competence protein ComEC
VTVLARVQRVASGGRQWTVSNDVLVLAPSAGWSGLLPSQRLVAEGRLAPRLRVGLISGLLSVHGPP